MTNDLAPGVPAGYRSLNPYLIVGDGAAALAFYTKAFGGRETMRHSDDEGRVAHAEMAIGDSLIMVCGENPAMNALSPKTLGGSPLHIVMYVPDVDEVFARAVAAGGTAMGEIENKPYGDRLGTITDPFGHVWYVNTRLDDAARTGQPSGT